MRGQVVRVAWYRFRATFSRKWGGYLSIVLLIALAGGIGLGSIAAARRTQASFSVFLQSTNPSDLSVTGLYRPNITENLAKLPGVERVEATNLDLTNFPMSRTGAPIISQAALSGELGIIGSIDGEYFDQDRVAVTEGRLADPKRRDEFVATAEAEQDAHWHLGEVVPMGFYTVAQTELPDFGTSKVKPRLRLEMRLVGTVVFNNEVVLDDVDRYPTNALFTPALTDLFDSGQQYRSYALKLRDGSGGVSAVELEIIAALPRGTTYSFHVTSVVEGQVNRTVKPEAIALWVFGAIAVVAAILIALQMIARQFRSSEQDAEVLRALGASRAVAVGDKLLGTLGAVLVGSLLAVGVAVVISPLSPIGPVRAVYPTPGFAVDLLVLGLGLLVLVGVTSAVSAAVAYRSASGRLHGARSRPSHVSGIARFAADAGASASAVAGVRFALEPGHGRTAVPVRSALFGTVLAIMIVVSTLTFGSGFNTLVSHPALYGWDWSYALSSNYLIPPQSLKLLGTDPDVEAWSGVNFANAQIDGLTVPILLVGTHASVAPPMLSGHPLETKNQIVLGAATLAELHKHVGEIVTASYGSPKDAPVYVPPTMLRIVGTATLPAIGSTQTQHTSMGTGAEIPVAIEPAQFRKFLASPDPTLNGPGMALVRLWPNVSPAAGLANLRRIAAAGNRAFLAVPNGGAAGASVTVLPVQYPAGIESYRTIGDTPLILAGGLAISAVVALGLTLVASVRRRRRDLALFKSLGFTERQLTSTVAWQATVIAVIGVVAGIPLGIALGRWLWILFAQEIYAVPLATVPVLPVVLVGLGALVLANVVAALPGHYAASTPTALVLRTE